MPPFSPTTYSISSNSTSSHSPSPERHHRDDGVDKQVQSTFKQAFATQLEQRQVLETNVRRAESRDSSRAGGPDNVSSDYASTTHRTADKPSDNQSDNQSYNDRPSYEKDRYPEAKALDARDNSSAARDNMSTREPENQNTASDSAEGGRGDDANHHDKPDDIEDGALANQQDASDAEPKVAADSVTQNKVKASLALGLAPNEGDVVTAQLHAFEGAETKGVSMAAVSTQDVGLQAGLLGGAAGGLQKSFTSYAHASVLSPGIDMDARGVKTQLGLTTEGMVNKSLASLSTLSATGETDGQKLTGSVMQSSLQAQTLVNQSLAGQTGLQGGLSGQLMRGGESLSSLMINSVGPDAPLAGSVSTSDDAGAKFQSIAGVHSVLAGGNGLAAAGRLQIPVNIAFGQAGWAEMVADRSAMMAAQSIKFAEIQLDPPELGQLQVKVSVHHDQASISFVAPNAHVKDALDQTIARLKEMLQEQGLNLADVDVSDQSSSQSSDQEGLPQAAADVDDIDQSDELQQPSVSRVHYGVDHYA